MSWFFSHFWRSRNILFKEIFYVAEIENTIFNFIGLKLNQTNKGITVDQCEYIQSLEVIKLDPVRKGDINKTLVFIEKYALQSKIGQP